MNKIQRERCEKAITTLRALKLPKGAKFDMGGWGRHDVDHAPAEHNYCGTVACAAGWLSLDPWFQRHGLRGEFDALGLLHPFGCKQGFVRMWELLHNFFGLTHDEAECVFGPLNGGTAKDAARRFQMVLKARGAK